MKTLNKLALILLVTIVSTSIYGQDKKKYNVDNSNIALQGYSAVSYLDLGIAQKGSKQFKSEYDKVAYYFTSSEQKTTFEKNPQKYLPQYGGYCAFGTYAGAKFRVDSNKFIVKDGKYFLYLYNVELDAQQLWLAEKDHKALVKKANENWTKLSATYN